MKNIRTVAGVGGRRRSSNSGSNNSTQCSKRGALLCRRWLRGSCHRKDCRFLHANPPLPLTPPPLGIQSSRCSSPSSLPSSLSSLSTDADSASTAAALRKMGAKTAAAPEMGGLIPRTTRTTTTMVGGRPQRRQDGGIGTLPRKFVTDSVIESSRHQRRMLVEGTQRENHRHHSALPPRANIPPKSGGSESAASATTAAVTVVAVPPYPPLPPSPPSPTSPPPLPPSAPHFPPPMSTMVLDEGSSKASGGGYASKGRASGSDRGNGNESAHEKCADHSSTTRDGRGRSNASGWSAKGSGSGSDSANGSTLGGGNFKTSVDRSERPNRATKRRRRKRRRKKSAGDRDARKDADNSNAAAVKVAQTANQYAASDNCGSMAEASEKRNQKEQLKKKTSEQQGNGVKVADEIQATEKKKSTTRNGGGSGDWVGNGGKRVEKEQAKKRIKRPRPNYFLSVRVENNEIKRRIMEIQKGVVERDPHLFKTMVSVEKLHLTLFVLHLVDEEAIQAARDALGSLSPEIRSLSPITVEFDRLGTFGKNVLFASIRESEGSKALQSLAERVYKHYEKLGITHNAFNFKPHLTIAKTSKARGWFRRKKMNKKRKNLMKEGEREHRVLEGEKKEGSGKKKRGGNNKEEPRGERERVEEARERPQRQSARLSILPEVYADFADQSLGKHTFKGVELLSMMEMDNDGYYKQLAFAPFRDMRRKEN